MAFLCDNCQLFFSHKLMNCPFCGGKIHIENISQQSLLQDGYTLARLKDDPDIHQNSNDSVSVEDSDIIASLRKSYHREHSQTEPQPQRQSSSPETDNNRGFFSQFQSSTTEEDIPTVVHTKGSVPSPGTGSIDSELQSMERLQQRIRNNYRRIALLNFISNIQWGAVFRILVIIGIIVCALTIWNMRYLIINAIIDFLLSLIPIIILIWVIVYVIKSLFK